MFISITVMTTFGLKNLIVSEYYSNEDLLEACLASSTIPYITERKMYRTFRGMKVVDGGLTNNTPVFRDGTRRQLIFRLSQVNYYYHYFHSFTFFFSNKNNNINN